MSTPQEIFQRYVLAGAIGRDADALAALFTDDGVLEAPLVPDGDPYPKRLVGRDAIRAGVAALHARLPVDGRAVDPTRTSVTIHPTPAGDTFVAEIDTAFTNGDTISLVQIFRLDGDRIRHLRDYFAPGVTAG